MTNAGAETRYLDNSSKAARLPTDPLSRGPVGWAAKSQVWSYRQHGRHDDGLQRTKPVEDDHLVHKVERHRGNEDLPDRLPTVTNQFFPMRRMGEERPEVGRPVAARVLQSIAKREERGHQRLQVKPQGQRTLRTRSDLMPSLADKVVHGSP